MVLGSAAITVEGDTISGSACIIVAGGAPLVCMRPALVCMRPALDIIACC